MVVLIVDYEGGNLASVRNALSNLGAQVLLSKDPDDVVKADRILLPGVGSFSGAMSKLALSGWPEALRSEAQAGKPLLGVCVGMQVLATSGVEGGYTEGLGLVSGTVGKLSADQSRGERVPHMGWNSVSFQQDHPMFHGVAEGTDFYFAHSFHFLTDDADSVLGTTEFNGQMTAVVGKDNVIGVQFHPEISSKAGRRFLQNFLNWSV